MVDVGTADMAIAAMVAHALDPVMVAVTSVMAEDADTATSVVMAAAVSTKHHRRPAETWGALKPRSHVASYQEPSHNHQPASASSDKEDGPDAGGVLGPADLVEEQSLRLVGRHDVAYGGKSTTVDLAGTPLLWDRCKAHVSPCSLRHSAGGTLQPLGLLGL